MKPRLQELYETKIRTDLQKELEISNVMNIPKIQRISLNIGIGDAHSSPKKLEAAINEMGQITGQQPVKTYAKKSIAGFKIREGMVMGCSVSLRRARMYEFLDRLINLALPRVRDFRGVSSKSFDGRGNYNIGIKEQIIFPEIDFDKIDAIRGMNISIVTTAQNDDQARALLRMFNMPFRK